MPMDVLADLLCQHPESERVQPWSIAEAAEYDELEGDDLDDFDEEDFDDDFDDDFEEELEDEELEGDEPT